MKKEPTERVVDPEERERNRVEMVREALRRTAVMADQLADKIHANGGDALKPEERTLVRCSVLPMMEEYYRELKFAFLAGDTDHIDRMIGEINLLTCI